MPRWAALTMQINQIKSIFHQFTFPLHLLHMHYRMFIACSMMCLVLIRTTKTWFICRMMAGSWAPIRSYYYGCHLHIFHIFSTLHGQLWSSQEVFLSLIWVWWFMVLLGIHVTHLFLCLLNNHTISSIIYFVKVVSIKRHKLSWKFWILNSFCYLIPDYVNKPSIDKPPSQPSSKPEIMPSAENSKVMMVLCLDFDTLHTSNCICWPPTLLRQGIYMGSTC